MEDPTTLAINLTYLGTLGMAVLMFLGLGLVIIITLVVAGVGRLLSIVLLAMVGIFPKKETTPIVRLPRRPARGPAEVSPGVVIPADVAASPLDQLAAGPHPDTAQVEAVAAAAVAEPSTPPAPALVVETPPAPVPPKRDLLGGARRRIAEASAAVKDGAWKAAIDPRKLPKPEQVKDAVENQTSHHPLLIAAAKEPPVLAKDWADAVAEADERAAARAKADQPPAIKVTVRDIDETGSSAKPSTGNGSSPDSGAASAANPTMDSSTGNGAKKPEAAKTAASAGKTNGATGSGPKTSKNGKSPSPIRKGSLSGASRNS
ncbi:hypothetical protein ACIPWF_05430 [Paenarthrobacter sp. NPDC089989]|uniref:hypothetical protein n=1 Tax=unclassified Paenarthrobacter TaxID=2634190 RepID=UPI0037F5A7B2